jgi:hypothetical protein
MEQNLRTSDAVMTLSASSAGMALRCISQEAKMSAYEEVSLESALEGLGPHPVV